MKLETEGRLSALLNPDEPAIQGPAAEGAGAGAGAGAGMSVGAGAGAGEGAGAVGATTQGSVGTEAKESPSGGLLFRIRIHSGHGRGGFLSGKGKTARGWRAKRG